LLFKKKFDIIIMSRGKKVPLKKTPSCDKTYLKDKGRYPQVMRERTEKQDAHPKKIFRNLLTNQKSYDIINT